MSRLTIAAAVVILMLLRHPVSALRKVRLSSLSRTFVRSKALTALPSSLPRGHLPFRCRLITFTALAAMSSSTATTAGVTATATPAAPREFFRKDYQPSAFQIPEIFLSFQLGAAETHVTATSSIVPAPLPTSGAAPDLVLDGEDSIELLEVKINGAALLAAQYSLQEGKLCIPAGSLPAGPFTLETRSRLQPNKNLALSGLYSSGPALLCTQCEAMGFRRIAFHLDRPDVLSRYKVRGKKAWFPCCCCCCC